MYSNAGHKTFIAQYKAPRQLAVISSGKVVLHISWLPLFMKTTTNAIIQIMSSKFHSTRDTT